MSTATDFFQVTPTLEVLLWIEALVYLSIGVFELFDDFITKTQPRSLI